MRFACGLSFLASFCVQGVPLWAQPHGDDQKGEQHIDKQGENHIDVQHNGPMGLFDAANDIMGFDRCQTDLGNGYCIKSREDACEDLCVTKAGKQGTCVVVEKQCVYKCCLKDVEPKNQVAPAPFNFELLTYDNYVRKVLQPFDHLFAVYLQHNKVDGWYILTNILNNNHDKDVEKAVGGKKAFGTPREREYLEKFYKKVQGGYVEENPTFLVPTRGLMYMIQHGNPKDIQFRAKFRHIMSQYGSWAIENLDRLNQKAQADELAKLKKQFSAIVLAAKNNRNPSLFVEDEKMTMEILDNIGTLTQRLLEAQITKDDFEALDKPEEEE